MTRGVGLALLGSGPLARARKAAGYLWRPRLLAHKLRRLARRWRAEAAYREAFGRGGLVVEPPAPPADVLFTVAMPVHRVAEAHLRAAIASVRRQTHRRWELVLLDDASGEPHVARVLAEAAREDARITVMRHVTNAGIAAASNAIVGAARGDYVAFLDHDDELHERALELAARFLAARPETDWLFTDEDKVDERGVHHEPCLKPGWSPHLLLSFNYVAHLRVVRRALLARLGGHRTGLDGAQDYDLALRALAAGARFAHLPGVLYHWRTVPASMARLAAAKPLAHEHALRALVEHAKGWPRGGEVSAEVLLAPASLFSVRRAADAELTLAILAGSTAGAAVAGLGRELAVAAPPAEPGDAAALIEAVRRCSADVVALAPAAGFSAPQLDELLALLMVPGTAIAAGRTVRRGQVAASGWVATDAGAVRDPCAGLGAGEPGYLNLALLPGPRLAPPATGWAAWRGTLLAAWDAAPEIAAGWRLPIGLQRVSGTVVTAPDVSFPAAGAAVTAPPSAPLPAEAIPRWSHWLDELGLQ